MTTLGEDSLTRLSEEEQQAILYWTETIGVPVFPATLDVKDFTLMAGPR